MYIPGDQPDALDALLDYYHGLCESAPSLPKASVCHCCRARMSRVCSRLCTLQVQEGVVDLLYEERIAIILQPGDLFTVPDHSAWSITMRSEESGALRLITPNELQRAHQSPDWAWFHTRLLTAQNQALTLAFAASNRHGMRPTAGFRRPEGRRRHHPGSDRLRRGLHADARQRPRGSCGACRGARG